jgi:hypothetical protein
VEGQFNYGNDPSMQRGAFGIQKDKKNLGSAKSALMANILPILFHTKLIAIVQFLCGEMWVLIISNSPSSPLKSFYR